MEEDKDEEKVAEEMCELDFPDEEEEKEIKKI